MPQCAGTKWREAESENMKEKVIDGRYEYKRSLGKGGNGSVFLCYDIKLKKEWAVKELYIWEEVELNEEEAAKVNRKNDVTPKTLQSTELELLKTISCNLFPRIVDVVYEEDKFYLVMDYVEGVTLKEKMQRQKLTEKDVLPWAVEIAKALRYLHQMSPQILYMDCKPENIIITPQGEIRLVDLGSVYICGSERKQRISGTRFFSPMELQNTGRLDKNKRMSTEQTPDVRSDIYAFGMTLYYLLAGRKKIYRRKGRLSVKDADPTVSEGMNEIIARCTENDPSKRLQSMEEVLYQLTHIKEISKQIHIKNNLMKAVTVFVEILCIATILIGTWLYVGGREWHVLLGILCATVVFWRLCKRRSFTLYEVKKEVFCGSGKRVLLYGLVLLGVLQLMTVSVFAEESRGDSKMQRLTEDGTAHEETELDVIIYDWQGRKLLLKDDTVWKVSEDILLSIPIEELEEAEGKITVLYEDNNSGTVKQYELSCCRK